MDINEGKGVRTLFESGGKASPRDYDMRNDRRTLISDVWAYTDCHATRARDTNVRIRRHAV